VLDEEGLVENIVAADRNVAHRIIEEFMLAANETVARHLEETGWPALYRIHEPPAPEKVANFDAFTTTLGHGLGVSADRVRPRHFQQLLRRVHGRPEARPVAMLMLRTMQKARYAPDNVGHFGLASKTYAHFTSPIRRYPDLVVHRLLREARRGAPTAERIESLEAQLGTIGDHTSAMERRAEDAEREVVHWKKVRFMSARVGEEFTGYVIGVTGFGLFVELVEPFVEGLVHISSMADDYYRFVEADHLLVGDETGAAYRLGDRVRVRVLNVDTRRRQIDLGLVDILDAVRAAEGREGRGGGTRRPRRPRPRR